MRLDYNPILHTNYQVTICHANTLTAFQGCNDCASGMLFGCNFSLELILMENTSLMTVLFIRLGPPACALTVTVTSPRKTVSLCATSN